MGAAITELDSLPNAIRSAAQNHDFWARLGVRFVFVFVSGIEVRRERFKFRRAGIDALEHRGYTVSRALQAHGSGRRSPNLRPLPIPRSLAPPPAQPILPTRLYHHP